MTIGAYRLLLRRIPCPIGGLGVRHAALAAKRNSAKSIGQHECTAPALDGTGSLSRCSISNQPYNHCAIQVFKGRVDCDHWSREGWGPVVLTIEVSGVRNRNEFVCLTHLEDVSGNVRPTDIWMEADGTFKAETGEVLHHPPSPFPQWLGASRCRCWATDRHHGIGDSRVFSHS